MTALVALLLALAPLPRDLIARLDAPAFRTREAADRELRRRLLWPQAIVLAAAPPQLEAEGRARLRRILDDYFRVIEPKHGWPRLDAIDTSLDARDSLLVRWYLAQTTTPSSWPYSDGDPYREATRLFVADLRRCFVPPALVRFLLDVMSRRECRNGAWQRMPQPLDP